MNQWGPTEDEQVREEVFLYRLTISFPYDRQYLNVLKSLKNITSKKPDMDIRTPQGHQWVVLFQRKDAAFAALNKVKHLKVAYPQLDIELIIQNRLGHLKKVLFQGEAS